MADTPEDKEYLDALVLLYSGMTCFDRGDHDDAIERYTIALKILDKWAGGSPHFRPDDKRKGGADKMYDVVLSLRGDAYKATGDHERALADYNASIALNAENVRSYMARADLHERMADRNSAIADFQKALDLNPDMLPQYVNECKQALKRLGTMH